MYFSCKEFITKLRITVEQKLCSPLVEDVVNELVRSYLLTAALFDKCSRLVSVDLESDPKPGKEKSNRSRDSIV